MTLPRIPYCQEDDHDWRYDGGDSETGINGAWICQHCGKVDVDREPPGEDPQDSYEDQS